MTLLIGHISLDEVIFTVIDLANCEDFHIITITKKLTLLFCCFPAGGLLDKRARPAGEGAAGAADGAQGEGGERGRRAAAGHRRGAAAGGVSGGLLGRPQHPRPREVRKSLSSDLY